MGANKFATMLHKNTNRMAVVLVYTVLEWILIALLLLNAIFSYLIARFAAYFGLQAPCILCSRLDRGRARSSYGDLVCDAHAAEISALGYCAAHRKLADAGEMCEDCSSSSLRGGDHRALAWMKRSEAGERDLRCSCCGAGLESGFYSPYLPLGDLHEASDDDRGRELAEVCLDADARDGEEKEREEEEGETDVLIAEQEQREEEEEEYGEWQSHFRSSSASLFVEDRSSEVLVMSLRIVSDEDRLVPVDVIDADTMKFSEACRLECDDGALDVGRQEQANHDIKSSSGGAEEEIRAGLTPETKDEMGSPAIGTTEIIKEYSLFVPAGYPKEDRLVEPDSSVTVPDVINQQDSEEVVVESLAVPEGFGEVQDTEVELVEVAEVSGEQQDVMILHDREEAVVEAPALAENFGEDHDIEVESLGMAEKLCELQGPEEDTRAVEANCEVSIGSEICDQEENEESQLHEPMLPSMEIEDQCIKSYDERITEDRVVETEQVETAERAVDHLTICPELNEAEEDRAPETPTYIEGIHALHRRFLFERRESGTESVDGSVASEIEGTEALTVDHLKAALKAERKALSALYAELEEERSASAIAANQTMAMITRLQEEKAAMQMEALQYQRMMEEQSEYDQEALQLLNELMMKREKEKQELEKEMEVYRKKVLLYEARERRRMTRSKANGGSGVSSASSSAEDSDDLSFDINGGEESSDGLPESNQNTPVDAVLSSETDQESGRHLITLDESLAEFEDERLAILEQLKALEEKLFTLDDEEPYDNKDLAEHLSEDGHGVNGHYESSGNGVSNFMNLLEDDIDTREKLMGDRKSIGYSGKRLLPLFDAIDMQNEELRTNQEASDTSPDSLSKLAAVQKKLEIAEEVDNVYERLQALEADREFLKHCISSLKKGDKGMDLLQEILQHLRDLRTVELRVRNAGDALASLPA